MTNGTSAPPAQIGGGGGGGGGGGCTTGNSPADWACRCGALALAGCGVSAARMRMTGFLGQQFLPLLCFGLLAISLFDPNPICFSRFKRQVDFSS